MTVYVVSRGTQFEGSRVHAIYANKEDAILCARQIADTHNEAMLKGIGNRQPDLDDGYRLEVRDCEDQRSEVVVVVYEWSCYYTKVEEMKVRE